MTGNQAEALCIGQSPLQLLNLVEAAHHDRVRATYLMVCDSAAQQAGCMRLLKHLGVERAHVYSRTAWFRAMYPALLGMQAAQLRGKAHTVYFGTWTSWAAFLTNAVKAPRHVLVDDGQKTINLLRAPHLVGMAPRWYRRGPWSKDYVARAELYTYYDELAQACGRVARPNRWLHVRHALHGLVAAQDPLPARSILFLGTNVTTQHAGFEGALQRVLDHAQGRPLVYWMHPADDGRYLDVLAKRLGFTVRSSEWPVELVFEQVWMPQRPEVWSFGTTATDVLQALHPDLVVSVHPLALDGFRNTTMAAAFAQIYEHYRQAPRVRWLA